MYVLPIPTPPSSSSKSQSRTNSLPPGEPIGYISRALSAPSTDSLALFLLQSLFLLLPPVLFAATLYMIYGRLVRSLRASKFSAVSPRWCTRVFVLADLACLNIQSTGGGLLGSPKNAKIGEGIVVAGLALQVAVFVGFMGVCVAFHYRYAAHTAGGGDRGWQTLLYMLYATSVLISVRNVFRLVEYVMGKGSYLFAHEWPMYVFDGALMLIVMVLFYVWYPDRLGARTDSMIELTSEGGGVDEDQRVKRERSELEVFARGVGTVLTCGVVR
jgi:ABC-type antimicrobial peptide transport system permease subunit